MMIIDGFLNKFEDLKKYASVASFNREASPADGAVYPAIDFNIPDDIKTDFVDRIQEEKGFKINPRMIFLRANALGEAEPYQAHNDLNMADHTCILYLTDRGGTAFVQHKETGVDKNDFDFYDAWARDCNKYDKWEVKDFCEMKPNRALFFDAELMHRGEPIEGYGEGNDSRMIMVCFYDRAVIC